jgi:hypothetical protein
MELGNPGVLNWNHVPCPMEGSYGRNGTVYCTLSTKGYAPSTATNDIKSDICLTYVRL